MISKEEYQKAIEVTTKYHLENDGFYCKLLLQDKKDVFYFDDLEEFANFVYRSGVLGSGIHKITKITESEFNQNHLPF